MSNVTVTVNQANITVDEGNTNVAVTTTTSNVTVAELPIISNTIIRASLSVTDTGGDGSLAYDNTNGVFTYTGVSAAETRAHFSATAPVTLASGVIGIDEAAIFSGKTTDDLAEGSTNLYWTTARGNSNFDTRLATKSTSDLAEGTNLYYTTARANTAITGFDGVLTPSSLIVTGNATIGGNLDVTGNINSETVVDLLVEDRNITLQYGLVTSPTANAHLFIDRGSSANVAIFWDETNDTWAYNSSNVLDTTADKNFVPYYNANSNVDYAGNIRLSNTSIGNSTTVSNIYSNPSFETSVLGGNIETAGRKLRFHNDINVLYGNYYYGNAEVSSLYGALTFTRPEGSQPYGPTSSTNFGNSVRLTPTNSSFGNVNSRPLIIADDPVFPNDDHSILYFEGNVFFANESNSGGNVRIGTYTSNTNIVDGTVITEVINVGSNAEIITPTQEAVLNLTSNSYSLSEPSLTLWSNTLTRVANTNPNNNTATTFSPGGIRSVGLSDSSYTPSGTTFTGSVGFDIDLTTARFFGGTMTGGSGHETNVALSYDHSYFSNNPSADFPSGKLSITGQSTNELSSSMHDIVTSEDLEHFEVTFGQEIQASNGMSIASGKTISGAGGINVSGDVKGTTITTDAGAAGIISASGNISTFRTITGGSLVANANITGVDIYGNYLHGDGSNITGIAGDIESVTAGVGLSGGGTTGAVTLNLDPTITTASASAGGSLAYDNTSGVFTFAPADLSAKIELTNLSVTTITPSGDGALAYDNTSGIFTFTPSATQTDAEVRALLSTTTASASGGGSLAYDNSSGVFTFAPADSVSTATNATNTTNVAITDDTSTDAPHYVTLSPAASGNQGLEVSSSKLSFNPSSGVLQTDHISSASAQPLQLKGQTDGIQLDTTIATVSSRIFDTDTTGYSVADADLGSENITTVNTPQILTVLYGTAGSSTVTCLGLAAASGIYTAFEQTAGFPYPGAYWNPSQGGTPGDSAQTSLEMALTTSGSTLGGVTWDGLANLSGWAIYDVTSASSTYLMSAAGHIVSISGNTVTLSEPLLQNVAGAVLLVPGAFSSTQNMGLRITGDNSTNAMAYKYAQTGYNAYDLPETLSNVTLDRVSYGNTSTVDMANVVMRHSADIQTGPDSAIRIPRAMLIGANATPDLLSVGTNSPLPSTSTLGLTIEQDGLTNYGPVETIPQMKVMLNNYKTGSLASQTAYPNWSQFLGQSGNATVDMKFLGAPNFNFKLLGGTKDALTTTSPGDIPGRITWNPAITTGFSGSDQFNPPASITAMIGGAGDPTSMANVDMYLQSTSPFSYRDGTTTASSIPNTFLASRNGATTIAANQFGKISLQPTRDYGDNATGDTYIDNRYAHKLHDYHSFLDAGWGNANTKSGTIVNIQSKSGQQFGTTTGFNYDSSGDATLRLSTHNTDNTVKSQWDIEANKTSGNLSIINSINSASLETVVTIDSATADFTATVASPAATSTSAVINFTKPTIFGTATTALTGNITDSLTGAKLGTVQKIYHNASSEPTYPAGWVQLGVTLYVNNQLNIINCEFAEGSRVEYWITQEL